MSNEAQDADTEARPLAKHLWYQLDGRSEADRRFVLNALQRRLTPKTQLPNQAIAIAALEKFDSARLAAATAGERPGWACGTYSKRNYNAFRSAQPDPGCLPSSTLIANAFRGRWGDALAAAGLDVAPDVLARRGINQGHKYSAEEVRSVLRAWIAEVDRDDPAGPLVQAEFAAWSRRNASGPGSGGLRYPTLPTVFKYLGKWAEVLIDLGQLDRHPEIIAARRQLDASPDREWASDAVKRLDLEALPKSAGASDPDYAGTWLRWVTEPLPRDQRAGLEMHRWGLLRAALLVSLGSLGSYAEIPSAEAIKSAADDRSWPTAKARAGIVDPSCCTQSSPTTRPFEDAELIDALAAAARELGHPPTRSEYEAHWRKAAGAGVKRLPSEATLRARLGDGRSWGSVLERLASEHPELSAGGGGAR